MTLRLVRPGDEGVLIDPGARFERHHHCYAYVAVIIRGTCEEAGDHGRVRLQPGDVIAHAPFEGHCDRIGRTGATFLNFRFAQPLRGSFGRIDDLDQLVRTWEFDPREAAHVVLDAFRPTDARIADWPDLLARDLGQASPFSLEHWADREGLHPASVSRGFRQAYGVSPKRYRLEQRASQAARSLTAPNRSLSAVAHDCGFADQAHMTRTLSHIFGLSPGALRRSG